MYCFIILPRQVSSLQLVTLDTEEKVLKCHDKIDSLTCNSCQPHGTESNSNQAPTELATQPGTSSYSHVLGNRALVDNVEKVTDYNMNNRTNETTTGKKSSLKDKRKSPPSNNHLPPVSRHLQGRHRIYKLS